MALVSKNFEIFPEDSIGAIINYYRHPASRYPTSVGEFTMGDVDYTSKPRIAVAGGVDEDGFFIQISLGQETLTYPRSTFRRLLQRYVR